MKDRDIIINEAKNGWTIEFKVGGFGSMYVAKTTKELHAVIEECLSQKRS